MVFRKQNTLRYVRRQIRLILWHLRQFYIEHFFLKAYITEKFKKYVGYYPDLKNPETFNEKLQWLKLYWRDPRGTVCADKYAVRAYVQSKIGGHFLNEFYALYDRVEDINIAELPDSFVLKATHGSGWNIICYDKRSLDWDKAFADMKTWLASNYYNATEYDREWVYKNIKPHIICEKYLATENKLPTDYKIFCFNGKPRIIQVNTDRDTTLKIDFYDLGWNRLPCRLKEHPNSGKALSCPGNFNAMLEASRALAADFVFVRTDFYLIDGKIIFGEMTFFPNSGLKAFVPQEYDHILGDMLTLPKESH